MEEVIKLLQEKNSYLEKFYSLNENEIANFSGGNFDNLEDFYNSRSTILEMIKSVDKRLEENNQSMENFIEPTDNVKTSVETELKFKDDIVHRILDQDLQALGFIEEAKSEIIRDLAKVRAVRKAVKSAGVPSINDRILDEEG